MSDVPRFRRYVTMTQSSWPPTHDAHVLSSCGHRLAGMDSVGRACHGDGEDRPLSLGRKTFLHLGVRDQGKFCDKTGEQTPAGRSVGRSVGLGIMKGPSGGLHEPAQRKPRLSIPAHYNGPRRCPHGRFIDQEDRAVDPENRSTPIDLRPTIRSSRQSPTTPLCGLFSLHVRRDKRGVAQCNHRKKERKHQSSLRRSLTSAFCTIIIINNNNNVTTISKAP